MLSYLCSPSLQWELRLLSTIQDQTCRVENCSIPEEPAWKWGAEPDYELGAEPRERGSRSTLQLIRLNNTFSRYPDPSPHHCCHLGANYANDGFLFKGGSKKITFRWNCRKKLQWAEGNYPNWNPAGELEHQTPALAGRVEGSIKPTVSPASSSVRCLKAAALSAQNFQALFSHSLSSWRDRIVFFR